MKKHTNLWIAPNVPELSCDLAYEYGMQSVYLPNIYFPPQYELQNRAEESLHINIGCFGAIRPMKNHLTQAMGVIKFGNKIGRTIKFHINGNRIEQRGDQVLKNLKHLFGGTSHELVLHDWVPHEKFIETIRSMHIGMQVSFSETFNIVGADFVSNGIPFIGSKAIPWLSNFYCANPTSSSDIASALCFAWDWKCVGLHRLTKWGLNKYNRQAKRSWAKVFKEELAI
jgi:hypothetical protein